jgi:Domain of Unknown Function (DUF928)
VQKLEVTSIRSIDRSSALAPAVKSSTRLKFCNYFHKSSQLLLISHQSNLHQVTEYLVKHYQRMISAFGLVSALTIGSLGANPDLASAYPKSTTTNGGTFSSGSHKGGTTCPANRPPLVAMAYAYANGGINVYGQTTQEQPTLWFYMPYSQADQLEVVFSLSQKDKTDDTLVPPAVALPNKPGFIAVRLPKALELGKPYKWELTVTCGGQQPPTVAGWIERVNLPELKAALNGKTELQKFDFYHHNGIWYDAVNSLAIDRKTSPQTTEFWRNFFLEAWDPILKEKERAQIEKVLTEAIVD